MKRIISTLIDLPNDGTLDNVRTLINLLNQMLRIRLITPPTTEIMIFLAHNKPNLYYATKKSILKNSNLNILFEIRGDNDIVEKRLQEFLSQL